MIDPLAGGPLAPLRERQFRLLFSARTVSFLGSAMAPVALAFAVLDLTGSKSDLGFVLAARTVPQVFFLLVGGVWADRLPRHHVMVASNVLSTATQAGVAALLLSGHARIWHLVALGAMNGASTAFFFPASQGIVPQTVHADLRQQGNALLRLGLNSANIAGAALGGLLVAATNPGIAIAIDAASFLAAAVLTISMRLPETARAVGSSFAVELREGWREFASRPWLWAIVLQFAFVNAAQSGAQNVLGPVVARTDLGGAAGWGLVLSCESVGLVAGGLVMLRLRPARLLRTATLAVLLAFPLLAGLAVPLPLAGVAALALVAGMGIETFSVLWDTAVQQEIPPDRLSRVYAYDGLGSIVLLPIAYGAVGPLAGAIGTERTLWLAFAVNTAVTLAALGVPGVRSLRRREGGARAPTDGTREPRLDEVAGLP